MKRIHSDFAEKTEYIHTINAFTRVELVHTCDEREIEPASKKVVTTCALVEPGAREK